MEIISRETVRGREWIFHWNGKLVVSKSKKEAEIKLMELQNGSLF